MKNIFFNGGGFTGFYEHLGAIKYIWENNLIFDKYYGVSSGASAIIVLLLKYDIEDFLSYIENIFKEQLLTNQINVTDIHMKSIQYCIDRYPDAYQVLNGKLYCGITTPTGFIWKSNFKSNEELANVLLCTGNIPFVCSYRAIIDNTIAIDGGIGLIEIPPDTLGISTTLYFPLSMIYPLSIFKQILIEYGYTNAKYIRRKPFLSSNNSSPEILKSIFFIESILPKKKTIDDLRYLLNKSV